MTATAHYDIIIAGAGLAGRSLAYRALQGGQWAQQRVLILDKGPKTSNDRTWCFWSKKPVPFADIAYRDWPHLHFYSNQGDHLPLQAAPYHYQMIRSKDFYAHTDAYLQEHPQVTWSYAPITAWGNQPEGVWVETAEARYTGAYLFNSIYHPPTVPPGRQYFLQHFKGLILEVAQLPISLDHIHLMDFRTPQNRGAAFFYTLPLDEHRLFVEYTLFSKSLLAEAEYDAALEVYLREVLTLPHYTIEDTEFGIIPMTDIPLPRQEGRIFNLGTAGGDTRPSTGYTFTNTQKTIGRLLEHWQQRGYPALPQENISRWVQLLDATLLRVLDQGKYPGHQIFYDLFRHQPAHQVFDFLEGDSNWWQELSIMRSVAFRHFIGPFLALSLNPPRPALAGK